MYSSTHTSCLCYSALVFRQERGIGRQFMRTILDWHDNCSTTKVLRIFFQLPDAMKKWPIVLVNANCLRTADKNALPGKTMVDYLNSCFPDFDGKGPWEQAKIVFINLADRDKIKWSSNAP